MRANPVIRHWVAIRPWFDNHEAARPAGGGVEEHRQSIDDEEHAPEDDELHPDGHHGGGCVESLGSR